MRQQFRSRSRRAPRKGEPNKPRAGEGFVGFGFHSQVLEGIRAAGFEDPTPVQAQSFEQLLAGRDLMAQSQTGTGKTATFLLTILNMVCTTQRPDDGAPRALVLAPTRELAIQIAKECRQYRGAIDARIALIYGGEKYHQQEQALEHGADIVVGTPGRLLDFKQQGKLKLHAIKVLVIDEADRLLDMGFWPDIRRILLMAPPPERRQTLVFSATLGDEARGIVYLHARNPLVIEIRPENITADGIQEVLYHVGSSEKFSLLLGVLRDGQPKRTLIFTNMKSTAALVARRLEAHGYNAQVIIGDMRQSKRESTLEDFRSGRVPILVASDIASRGLHVEDIDLIVNYDLPQDPESYVHRIGRTARLDKTGRAVSLADERYIYSLEPIEKFIGRPIPAEVPGEELFETDRFPQMAYERSFRDRGRRGDSRGGGSRGGPRGGSGRGGRQRRR